MSSVKSIRRILIVAGVLALLCVAIFLTVLLTKNYASERIVQKAQNLGWHLDLGKIQILGFSDICVHETLATNAEAKAELRFTKACVPLNIKLLRSRIPSEIEIYDLDVTTTSIKNMIRRPTKTSDDSGEKRTSAFDRDLPTLRIFGYQAQLKNDEVLAICRGQLLELKATDFGAAGDFDASCELNAKLRKARVNTEFNSNIQAKITLIGKERALALHFSQAVLVSTSYDDKALDLSFTGFGVQKSENEIIAELYELSLDLRRFSTLTKSLQCEKIRTTLRPGAAKPISELRLKHPVITLELAQILELPAIANQPLLAELRKNIMNDEEIAAEPAKKARSRKQEELDPKKIRKKKPIKSESIKEFKDKLAQMQAKLQTIPLIFVEDGSVVLEHDGQEYTVDALSFDSAQLQDADAQQYGFGFNLRGAQLRFDIGFTEDEEDFPSLDIKIEGLSPKDLFIILSLPQPKDMAGNFSARVQFRANSEIAKLAVDAEFTDFAIYHPMISQEMISNINATARFSLDYSFSEDNAKIDDLRLSSGPVVVNGNVELLNVRSYPILKFKLHSKNLLCSDIPKAFPAGILPSIRELRIEGGSMNPEISGNIPLKNPIALTLSESGFSGCSITSVAPHEPERLNESDYTFTYTRYTTLADGITVGPGTKSYIPLSQIPPYVLAAMYLTEDKRFFDHGPLRISFIERAMRLNLKEKRYVYGGSTISQQLTKNLFLDRNKNLARKLEEAFIAWRLETVVSKTRIFELYVNMIEFGPDIYGIKQAALFYFDKKPIELTPLQGAYLASLKVAPSKGGSFYKGGFSTKKWWNKRMKYILKILAENGYITPAEVLAAYPWIPEFYYPDPDDSADFRNVWLKTH
ncbi:MAG: transglycosylase domain-containing protein [Thiopseudomonas sp.]|nr:transglycosylase domain-containing protein [Thiopseudomonas sp.]